MLLLRCLAALLTPGLLTLGLLTLGLPTRPALAEDPTAALAQALRAEAPDETLDQLHQDGASVTLLARQHPTLLAELHAERRRTADWLLDTGFPPDLPDSTGDTALHHAVWQGDLQRVRALLDAGALPEPALLRDAVRNARLPLISALAEAMPDRHERVPDLLAAYLGEGGQNVAVVEWLLLDGADPEARNALGDSAVLAAARLGRDDLVRLLLHHGANPDAVSDSGCDLHCFYRDSRAGLLDRLPEINQRPLAFLVLAAMPVSLFYFVLAGWQLYRHRPLLPITLMTLLALLVMALAAATLFYRCTPCLVPPGTNQFVLTSALGLILSVSGCLAWLSRPYSRRF
ncbi:ankyrin repeat domain-containing protein [Isoalcanivorax indicus]|uniref:ankyrin repeat domain-containing protein n=1 Tax=Isoalcanivorax indicus TaxID=2202653 RepID=UPI000DB90553|nr:ankyrin repeat domain-containing protein [Isoalcanivorax indicus]